MRVATLVPSWAIRGIDLALSLFPMTIIIIMPFLITIHVVIPGAAFLGHRTE